MSPSYAKINQEWRKRGENPELYLQTYNAGHQWYFTYNELRPLSYCWYWVEKIMTKTKKMRISSRGWKKRRSDEEETGADDEHHDDDKTSHTKMDESGRRRWCWSKLGEDEEDICQLLYPLNQDVSQCMVHWDSWWGCTISWHQWDVRMSWIMFHQQIMILSPQHLSLQHPSPRHPSQQHPSQQPPSPPRSSTQHPNQRLQSSHKSPRHPSQQHQNPNPSPQEQHPQRKASIK